jgi:hypothetical protein
LMLGDLHGTRERRFLTLLKNLSDHRVGSSATATVGHA